MAEPIANDWKAIHDRMQQIRAEQSASFQTCPQCNGLGWMPYVSDRRQPQTVAYAICGRCRNLMDLSPPLHVAGR